jgi:hypothetical protein
MGHRFFALEGDTLSNALTLAERHREMAEERRRLATIGSSIEIRNHHLRMAEHYGALADAEERGVLANPYCNWRLGAADGEGAAPVPASGLVRLGPPPARPSEQLITSQARGSRAH